MGPGLGLAGTPLARPKCNLPVYCPRPASSLNFALNRTQLILNLKSTMNARAHISRAEPNRDCPDDPSEAPYPSQAGCHTPLHTLRTAVSLLPNMHQEPGRRGRLAQAG